MPPASQVVNSRHVMSRYRWRYLLLSGGVLAADRLSKWAVISTIPPGTSRSLWDDFLRLSHAHNTGSAFGILPGHNGLFLALAATSSLGIAIALFLLPLPGAWSRVGLSLILGGALGNLVDRALWGYVLDFIDFRFWPAFNLADAALVLGALVLGIGLLRGRE